MLRVIVALLLVVGLALPLSAQDTSPAPDRSATGGAQTLEDILARQRGENIDDDFRGSDTGDPDSAAAISSQLGTLGGASDPELWRALRYNTADVTASNNGPASTVLVQDGGMRWLQFREGPLIEYGGYLLLGTIALLAVFYLIRGRIRVDGEKTGRMVVRFEAFERFSHWLLAGSFLLLAFTGLISLMGRKFLIPTFGHDAFSTLAIGSKWIHNNVSWAFMIALVFVFVLWVVHNLPSRSDIKWIMQGGGILKKGVHPPAKKFNAGQKLIFWSVIVFGVSISVSGLSLLFPFEMPLFAMTFEKLNALGVPALIGMDALPTALSPQEEMQLSQLWHAIVAFVLMAIIIAHIYIGTLGMEGASDAMVTGLVEEQWAKEHHSLWYEKLEDAGEASGAAHTPAE